MSDTNKLKDNYKEIFIEARKRFNDWDPMGLIALEAPENEYDSYIEKLLINLNMNMNEEDIAANLQSHLKEMFSGKSPDLESCKKFSNDIHNWWNNL